MLKDRQLHLSRMTHNGNNTFAGLILHLLTGATTTITGLQFRSTLQFSYPLVNWHK